MSSIVDAQLQTIKSSFLKILEIGKSNCDGSTIIVLSILGQMDSALVKAALKERVVEIIETESSETMEASINEALRKHFLPPISQETSPRALGLQMAAVAKQTQLSSSPAAIPASQMAQPAKVELKESKAEEIPFPPKICALAKEAGMTPEQLKDRLQLVNIDGRLCGVFKDYHGDPALIKFLSLLDAAAQKKEIALIREGAFVDDKYKGYLFGLDEEALYIFTGFMKYCIDNELGTSEQIKDNQIRLLSLLNNTESIERDLFPDVLKILTARVYQGNIEAISMLSMTGQFLNETTPNELTPAQNWKTITLFKDKKGWTSFCKTFLLASFERIKARLPQLSKTAITHGLQKTWNDPVVLKEREAIALDMRTDEFVKAAVIAMPKIPKDVFTLFHMGGKHAPSFLSNLVAAVQRNQQLTPIVGGSSVNDLD